VIYLDFDGGTYVPSNQFHAGYNADGSDPTTFDAEERNVIYDAFNKVATWFAPFNVDVTTDASTPGGRVWILISNDVASGGAGSIGGFPFNGAHARMNSGAADNPNPKGIVHEITHNFGSNHNTAYDQWGDRADDAYAEPLDPLHGMIMGAGGGTIDKWMLWHRHNGVDGFEDQVKIITDALALYGDPYVPDDDVDSSRDTPLVMATSGVRRLAKGVIERPDDTDWYSFTIPTSGNYTVSVVRQAPSMVDVYTVLYLANGTTYFASEDGDPDEQPYQTVNDSFISPVYLVGGTTYKIRVKSHGDYADIGPYEVRVDPLLNGTNPNGTPMRWRARDIGLCRIPGLSYADGGTLTIQADGDINAVAEDAFHYVFQTLKGDGSIMARVEQVRGSSSSSEAGVMIRDGLSPLAPHVAVVSSYHSAKRLHARSTSGATSTALEIESGGNFSPVWVRLTRAGSTFTGEVADAQTGPWRLVGTKTVTMGSEVSIGLAVARNYNYLTTGQGPAKISSVSTTGNVNPQRTVNPSLAAPAFSVVSESYNSVLFNFTAATGAASTIFERSRDGMNFELAGQLTTGTQYRFTGLRGAERYWFRALSAGPDQRTSLPSAIKTTTTLAAPVTNVTVSNVAGKRETKLNIDWNETSGEAGYRVTRSSSASGPFADVSGVLAPNTPMFTNTGLTPNTNYYYRVETLRDLGGGSFAASSLSEVKGRYTALPTTTGGTITDRTTTSASMQCNSVSGATSYEIQRFTAAGSTPTNLTSPTRTFTDTGVSQLQWYRYAMRGMNANTWSNDWTKFMVAIPPEAASALPADWIYDDFGEVHAAGVAGMDSSGRFTLIASGSRLSENPGGLFAGSDQPGNPWIVARVSSLSDVGSWAQGGVMIRDAYNDVAKFVAAYATVRRGLNISYRTADGGAVTTVAGPEIDAPVKLRVRRTGASTFDAAYTTDNVTWISLGNVPNISMDSRSRVGLFANAGDLPDTEEAMEVARFTEVETSFSGGVYP
jgi:hypothetical protein